MTAVVHRAVVNALHQETHFKEQLLERHAFSIHQTLLSPDRRHLTISWDCFPPQAEDCSKDLERLRPWIQRAIASRLTMKQVPSLSFVRDKLTLSQSKAAAALESAEEELHASSWRQETEVNKQHHTEEDSTASSGTRTAAATTMGGAASLEDRVEQALRSLQSRRRRQPHADGLVSEKG